MPLPRRTGSELPPILLQPGELKMENHYTEPSPSNLQAASSGQVEAFTTSLLGGYPRAEAEDLERYLAGIHAVAEDCPNDILEVAANRESGLPAKCKFLPRLEELKKFRDEKNEATNCLCRVGVAKGKTASGAGTIERGKAVGGC